MRTELVTTLVALVFLMHVTTISPSAQPPSLLCLVSIFLTMAAVTLPLVISARHARSRNNGAAIPGPRGWPFLGALPTVSGPLMHRRLAALADAHGARRLMSLRLGATPVVISSDPETAREILSGAAFVDRPPKAAARELMFCRAIGFAPAGEYWRRLRRVAGAGMLSPRRVAALEGLRRRVAERMVEAARGEMERSGEVAVRGLVQRASLESMAGSVLGLEGDGVNVELGEMVREGYELVGTFNLGDHYYTSLWGPMLDLWGVGPRCRRLAARVREYFGKIIEERRVAGDYHERDDLLSYMLALPKEERLVDSDVIAVLWEMIFRGVDVVAILLEWTMARIALHPDIQSKAHQELDAVVGQRGSMITDSDIPNLRFLRSVVKETLRMHPPGPLLSWARLAVHDARVGKHIVPAGTTAMVNMWAISHDQAIWGDPWVFRPERFMEEGGEDVSVLGSDLRLAPFGAGRRICPGRMLGLATVHLWLAHFLRHYEWSPAARQPIKLAECLRLSMEMKQPLVCRAVPRGRGEAA